jgi:hypothetical protein
MLLDARCLSTTRLGTKSSTGFPGQESSYLYAFTHARSHSLENPSSKACGKKKSSLPDSQLSFPLYMAVTKVFINMHPSHGTRNENSVE